MLSDERRSAIRSVLGKQLTGVVLGESRTSPSSVQGLVVLVFADGTSYELYSGAHIVPTKHAGSAPDARSIVGAMSAAWRGFAFDSVSLDDAG
jgi:hypothetical protein